MPAAITVVKLGVASRASLNTLIHLPVPSRSLYRGGNTLAWVGLLQILQEGRLVIDFRAGDLILAAGSIYSMQRVFEVHAGERLRLGQISIALLQVLVKGARSVAVVLYCSEVGSLMRLPPAM